MLSITPITDLLKLTYTYKLELRFFPGLMKNIQGNISCDF